MGRGGGDEGQGGSALHYYLPVQIQSLHLTIVFGTDILGLIFLGTDFFGTKFLELIFWTDVFGTDFFGD